MNQNRFFKGNRVRYVSQLMPQYTGGEGVVTGFTGSLVMVRFDGMRSTTGCYPASLLKLHRNAKA